jgi:SSS family solute:Na+ symporter
MQTIDWILLIAPMLIVLGIGLYTQSYMKSVADFMTSGRMAGRYLLAVAKAESQAGAVVFVALFELTAKAGFTVTWWQWIQAPVMLGVAISGFMFYRYRETRAMTLAQFFEIRYSRKFRLFTGGLGFLAGILNFGIIPSVGAQFFVGFLRMPQEVSIFSVTVPTFILVMAVLITITVIITLSGGLITVMVTNCVEGILSQIFYLVIIIALVMVFKWSDISQVLLSRPPGGSLLNPFDSSGIKDFNIWYVALSIFGGVYGLMAWQNASGYNSAASTPHEARMGGVLGNWRGMAKNALAALMAVCALAFLEHPHFADAAVPAHAAIASMTNPKTQAQMEIPLAVSYMLPMGIKGLFCAVLLMGVFGGDSSHLHSWGGILVQDVLVPLRKRPFSPKQHIRALRLSIIGVAVFAFLFGSLFRQTEYIFMWWAVTGAVFIGGAGAVIIGGLYWNKGTTAAAWGAMLTGSILSASGIVIRMVYGEKFPINGQWVSFAAILCAIGVYVVVSLMTCKEKFNMDRMLHRGAYADRKAALGGETPLAAQRKLTWGRIIGFDENFTLADKWIAGALFGWSIFWFVVMAVGTIWNLLSPWPAAWWSVFWHIAGVGIPALMALVAAVWFTWGGLLDMRDLFSRLRTQTINNLDDGTVVGHQNLDEAALPVGSKPPGNGKQ